MTGAGRPNKPPYVTPHMIARFLGVKVWELDSVAHHYQEEAEVILVGQYQARVELASKIAKETKLIIPEIVIPDF